jgi:DNA-directed RNA polymerase subunit RPC12/RpoP
MIKHCPRCSNAVEMKTLERVSAEDAPLKLTVTGMPAAKCAKGHAAPIDRDFMLWLIQELKIRGGSLAAGEAKGMVFKKYTCACGKELESKSEKRQSFPLDLAYQGAPAFKAELDMPVYKCTGCGKEQLRSAKELQGHAAQAIAALNDAAGFPHSG